MMRLWKNLPRRKQNFAIGFVLLLLTMVFFGVEQPRMEKKMRAVAAQIDLREKRKKTEQPPIAVVPLGDPRKLAAERAELEKRAAELTERVRGQEMRLAPLDDLAAQRRLQLALAKLAQESDVEMESFKLIDETNRSARDEQLAPTVERLRTVLNNEFKRPLYLFKAKASYQGLMQVLDGLAGLEYAVVPVSLAVKVQVVLGPLREGAKERQILNQWLDVQLILAF